MKIYADTMRSVPTLGTEDSISENPPRGRTRHPEPATATRWTTGGASAFAPSLDGRPRVGASEEEARLSSFQGGL